MESSTGLRRKDTTKGAPLRILSLDGGGVRGFSMLLILDNLMQTTQALSGDDSKTLLKPCDCFDLIAGTGTGGLIAIMLGRLRMNLRECKTTYIEMTKKVFETDKTIAGIPYRSTLFKASKLEDAIRECVRKYENLEDNDVPDGSTSTPRSPIRPGSTYSDRNGLPRRSISSAHSIRSNSSLRVSPGTGDPNAGLEDPRIKFTKTAVTAVLKGTTRTNGTSIMLRSYRSRNIPSLESNCTIWQAGRATCATKLAFKPIQIGTSTFLDEGEGMTTNDGSPTYNPAPQVLAEAMDNEWPGREIGVFVSIGTGKRPQNTDHMQREWWEGFAGGVGDFAEAKRKLIMKIEGCEKTHEDMESSEKDGHLQERGVDQDKYCRLNVSVGVGEFGMNEWSRLGDISTNTNLYLSNKDVQGTIDKAAEKLATIEDTRRQVKQRHTRHFEGYKKTTQPEFPPPLDPFAVELPGEDVSSLYAQPLSETGPQHPANDPYPHQQGYNLQENFTVMPASDDKFTVIPSDESPLYEPDDFAHRRSNEYAGVTRPRTSDSAFVKSPRISYEDHRLSSPPPLPPKTPIPYNDGGDVRRHTVPNRGNGHVHLPYPDDDGPPPVVNMARKPQYVPR